MIVATAIFALSLLATPNCVFADPDSSELSCQEAYRVLLANETDFKSLFDGSIRTIQGDIFDSDDYVEVNGTKQICVCHLWPCIRKCCPEGAMFVDNQCSGTVNMLKKLTIPEKVGPALKNFLGKYGKDCGTSDRIPYIVDPRVHGDFYVSGKGVLTLPNADNYEFFDYCLDYIEEYEIVAVVCAVDPYKKTTFDWSVTTGFIMSALSNLLTFTVYALLPEQNLYNRLLMCYVMLMMIAYIIMITMDFIPVTSEYSCCTFLGTLCYFFFLSSFCCVNVIAHEIWSTFRNIRAPAMNKSKKGMKRILFYSLYVIGVPLIMIIMVIALTKISKKEAWYNPHMGTGACWLAGSLANFIYFLLPMMITVLISTILFASTAWHIKKIKNDTKQLEGKDSQKHEKGKKMFSVYLKLCLVMGVNMAIVVIVELVMHLIFNGNVPLVIEYLANVPWLFCGVFIFFLFVFKKSIWKQLKKRFDNESDVTIIGKIDGKISVTKL